MGKVSVFPGPSRSESTRDRMAALHKQLDKIQAVHDQQKQDAKLFDGLRFTGRGSRHRRQGGALAALLPLMVFFRMLLATSSCS